MNKSKTGTKNAKNTTKNSGFQQVITDFGTRKISSQNFSKVIALPKIALDNLGTTVTNLRVELVQKGNERFLKLSPARGGKN